MLKKEITYTDFNGEETTEVFFFNLSKAELVELELSHEGGLAESLQKISESQDGAAIIREMKNIILTSYGKKSPDGKRFIKNQQIRDEFESSEAYSVLFMELVTQADAAVNFINGTIPQGLAEEGGTVTPLPTPERKTITRIELNEMSQPDFKQAMVDITAGRLVIQD